MFRNVFVVDGINIQDSLVEELYAHVYAQDLPIFASVSVPLATQVMSHSDATGIAILVEFGNFDFEAMALMENVKLIPSIVKFIFTSSIQRWSQ